MSRSNPAGENANPNPTVRWFEWSGKHGTLKWYDRDTQENKFVDLPFRFLVLDQLNTVTGYSDLDQKGYYSNEVRKAGDSLIVKVAGRIVKEGRWKEDIAPFLPGAKFTKSVYIAFKDDHGEMALGNIKFSGSALGGLDEKAVKANYDAHKKNPKVALYDDEWLGRIGWFEFGRKHNVYEGAIELCEAVEDHKGATTFFRPVFKSVPASPETNEKAMALDAQLQEYLKSYFAREPEREAPVKDYVEEHVTAAGAVASGARFPSDDFGTGKAAVSDEDDIPFGLIVSLGATGVALAIANAVIGGAWVNQVFA